MIEGRIIKFYREKQGFTQGKLAEGICSVTHLSKIERGITEYSSEIMNMLAERLHIHIKKEAESYKRLHQTLRSWHDAIIMQQKEESAAFKVEAELHPLKELPDFRVIYQLLLSRYELYQNQLNKAYDRLAAIQQEEQELTAFEMNLLKHVLGIYYFLTAKFSQCIETLKSIIPEQYNNQEYFYHLALAYHSIHSNITAYYYGEQALRYFRKTLNLLRIIDTETLLLVELNAKELHDYEETKRMYQKLLRTCDVCKSTERKAKLMHNFAFDHHRRKKYIESSGLYKKAMDLMEESEPIYLLTLHGYVRASRKAGNVPAETLLKLAEKGLRLAEKRNSAKSVIDFKCLLALLTNNESEYYRLIEEEALPHIKESGEIVLIEHYKKKLYEYYMAQKKEEEAFKMAQSIMNERVSYYDYD
ncbi:helix-turn-helix domain-containing protein [Metabacillus sp. GX 13764]|uniref:helix-turn-helix domain-containing protein n=1 Tax=Metabacillus kandeliae TaxID=2900151 RepID=UPI001E5717A5|nr:helix-turn-helix domain-containing protein [Metabacillus kandeliae]